MTPQTAADRERTDDLPEGVDPDEALQQIHLPRKRGYRKGLDRLSIERSYNFLREARRVSQQDIVTEVFVGEPLERSFRRKTGHEWYREYINPYLGRLPGVGRKGSRWHFDPRRAERAPLDPAPTTPSEEEADANLREFSYPGSIPPRSIDNFKAVKAAYEDLREERRLPREEVKAYHDLSGSETPRRGCSTAIQSGTRRSRIRPSRASPTWSRRSCRPGNGGTWDSGIVRKTTLRRRHNMVDNELITDRRRQWKEHLEERKKRRQEEAYVSAEDGSSREGAERIANAVLTAAEARVVEGGGLTARGLVRGKYGVDPSEFETDQELLQALGEEEATQRAKEFEEEWEAKAQADSAAKVSAVGASGDGAEAVADDVLTPEESMRVEAEEGLSARGLIASEYGVDVTDYNNEQEVLKAIGEAQNGE